MRVPRCVARAGRAGCVRRSAMQAATAIEGKVLGDGVMATFPSAAQAIDGARRCMALSAASELGLHIGLHAGDVIREDGQRVRRRGEHRFADLRAVGAGRDPGVGRGARDGAIVGGRGVRGSRRAGDEGRGGAGAGVCGAGAREHDEPQIRYCTTADGVSIASGRGGRGAGRCISRPTPFYARVRESFAINRSRYGALARSFR